MRVIVTGATSFIGSHAVQTLINQGFEVCASDSSQFSWQKKFRADDNKKRTA